MDESGTFDGGVVEGMQRALTLFSRAYDEGYEHDEIVKLLEKQISLLELQIVVRGSSPAQVPHE
ncbi:hypothetical protein [Geodermatophilus sp. URMC 62]|uniref:hypothetical protein n=1 Tax=Geodermatophilus sp. URMC 62 TaxID=3423414 RepID=UPI00406C5BEE